MHERVEKVTWFDFFNARPCFLFCEHPKNLQSSKIVLFISIMMSVNEIVEITTQEREQEHWQRVGLLLAFGGSISLWLAIIILVKLIF